MPKTLRYGLIIAVAAIVLYLAARNFGEVIYSFGRAVMEAGEQEEQPGDVFAFPAGQGTEKGQDAN